MPIDDIDVVRRVANILVNEVKCDQGKLSCGGCQCLMEDGKCLTAVACDHLISVYRRKYEEKGDL